MINFIIIILFILGLHIWECEDNHKRYQKMIKNAEEDAKEFLKIENEKSKYFIVVYLKLPNSKSFRTDIFEPKIHIDKLMGDVIVTKYTSKQRAETAQQNIIYSRQFKTKDGKIIPVSNIRDISLGWTKNETL